MMVSTKGRYALRFLIDIAEHQAEGYVPLKEIAQRQGISEKYLESIVKTLVKEGVLVGLRGKGGGYRLSRSPDQFGVRQILTMMEGPLAPVVCLEGGNQPPHICLKRFRYFITTFFPSLIYRPFAGFFVPRLRPVRS